MQVIHGDDSKQSVRFQLVPRDYKRGYSVSTQRPSASSINRQVAKVKTTYQVPEPIYESTVRQANWFTRLLAWIKHFFS